MPRPRTLVNASYMMRRRTAVTLLACLICSMLLDVVCGFFFPKFELGHTAKENVEESVQRLTRNSWSECWKDALAQLIEGCGRLEIDDDQRSRFSVHLANCHLGKSGHVTYTCTDKMSIQECTHGMSKDPVAFHTYTEFFTHSTAICQHIQTEAFQQSAEGTINRLYAGSIKAMDSLNSVEQKTSALGERISESVTIMLSMRETQQEFLTVTGKAIQKVDSMTSEILTSQAKLHQGNKELGDSLGIVRESTTKINDRTVETLAKQENLLDAVQSLERKHTAMSGQLDSSLAKQEELLTLQANAHEEAKQHHADTLQGFIGLSTDVRYVHADVKDTLNKTQELMTASEQIQDQLDSAHKSVEQLGAKITVQTAQAALALEDITARIGILKAFQEEMLGQLFDIRTIVFYVATCVVGYVMTGTHLTYRARFPILLLLLVCMLVERWINAGYASNIGYEPVLLEDPQNTSLYRSVAKALLTQISAALAWLFADMSKVAEEFRSAQATCTSGPLMLACLGTYVTRTRSIALLRRVCLVLGISVVSWSVVTYEDASGRIMKMNEEILRYVKQGGFKDQVCEPSRQSRSSSRFSSFKRSKSPELRSFM